MNYQYKCPHCGGDALRVEVATMARLVQEDDGNIQTEVWGDHEWDNDSYMRCTECGHDDWASGFVNPDYVGGV